MISSILISVIVIHDKVYAVHYYTRLINILYNPAGYCEYSWLAFPSLHDIEISALPEYLKNHFLLEKSEPNILCGDDIDHNELTSLFINNWDKISHAAHLIGLKLLSAQIISTPSYIKNLSYSEIKFIYLPLPLSVPEVVDIPKDLSKSHISQVGANFIYGAAKELLPMIFLERLRFIFPLSFSYQNASCGSLNSALPALKWAFEYA